MTRAALEQHEGANQFYFEEGARIIELANKAYSLWIRQDPFEKRKLLDILLSNCTFDGENLHPDYEKPFCWLAEGLKCSDWLPVCNPFHKRSRSPAVNRKPSISTGYQRSGRSW